jgi:hypothetical protein
VSAADTPSRSSGLGNPFIGGALTTLLYKYLKKHACNAKRAARNKIKITSSCLISDGGAQVIKSLLKRAG